MIQEVKFQGLSHSPSDYEAQDGELGTCLNLINEDGDLKPISKPTQAESFTLPNSSCSIELVHKVTHDNETHSHYIVHCENGNPYSWYWTEKGGKGTTTQIDLGDFKVNSVCAIGNILCFVGDANTKYAFWNVYEYVVFDNSIFQYNIEITDDFFNKKNNGSETEKSINAGAYFTDDWDAIWASNGHFSNTSGHAKSATSSQIVFSGLDAIVSKTIEETDIYAFKYLSFGVVALKLFDGSYTNISNPFVLAPAFISNKFLWNDSAKVISTTFNMHWHSINVKLNVPENLKDLILGADVFISNPESFLDTNETFYTINDLENYMYDTAMKDDTYSFAMKFKSKDKIYKIIDNMSFYLSVSMERKDFNTTIKLKRISETNKSLSLADFQKKCYGGKVGYSFNNRLHLANVQSSIPNDYTTHLKENFQIRELGSTFTDMFETYLNNRLSSDIYDELEAISVVTLSENNIKRKIYRPHKIQHPLSPIISYPDSNATTIELYFKVNTKFKKITFPLHQSETMGISYYIHTESHRHTKEVRGNGAGKRPDWATSFGNVTHSDGSSITTSTSNYDKTVIPPDDDGIPSFICNKYYNIKETTYTGGSFGNRPAETKTVLRWDTENFIDTNNFEDITESEYNAIKEKCNSQAENYSVYSSLVKVSEAENPLVFPAKNSVQVGSSVINALAANTRSISEGQFGEAPLYAFTDEGVWVLMTNSEGTYDARQPANREICTNPKGILQIDDAVLYPTDKGIMMQQGRDSVCITDSLNGYPFDFTQLYKDSYAKNVLSVGNFDAECVRYAQLRKFLDDGENKADMIYDYYDNRIILFNPAYRYAYVYSLKSKMWSTMENIFTKRVNIYPESYAINKNGKIVDLYVKEPTEDVPYFLCSRPFGLSNPEVHKTMLSCITRGYFRNEKGKCGMILYGSNDLFYWFPIKTSVNKYLRGMAGSPYKYFRIALIGSLSPDESISGISTDIIERWQNKLR